MSTVPVTPETPPPDTAAAPPDSSQLAINWAEVVSRIRRNEAQGLEELYRVFSRGIRFYLCRQLNSQDLDDKIHDAFVIVVQAIRRGELREPERLMGFVRTVVRRQVAGYIDEAVTTRRRHADLEPTLPFPDSRSNPEQAAITKQRAELADTVLQGVSRRDREILTRFYLQEQTQEQICRQMHLSDTQFRLLKSRAKARFGELGRRRLRKKSWIPF